MPARPKLIDRRFATHYMLEDELAVLPAYLKPRLHVITALYRGAGTQMAAEIAEVSRRSAQRWLAVWNSFGPDALLARTKRGPKRKITREVFDQELRPLILCANGEVMDVWSIAEVQRKLAQNNEIRLSYATLRRTFRRFGYRPQRSPRQPAPVPTGSTPSGWEHPWSPEYGSSMTDYLRNADQALSPEEPPQCKQTLMHP